VPMDTPASAATSLMVARFGSDPVGGKRLLRSGSAGHDLHIAVKQTMYRLDDPIRAL
jgi:hypothetical protein